MGWFFLGLAVGYIAFPATIFLAWIALVLGTGART